MARVLGEGGEWKERRSEGQGSGATATRRSLTKFKLKRIEPKFHRTAPTTRLNNSLMCK